MYDIGVSTGVNAANREQVAEATLFDKDLPGKRGEVFVAPQTSGGLLAAIPEAQVQSAVAALRSAGVEAACSVGMVTSPSPSHLVRFR